MTLPDIETVEIVRWHKLSACNFLPAVKYLRAGSRGGRGKIYPFLRKLGKIYKYSAKKGHHIFQRISVRGKFKNSEVVKGKIYKYSLKKRSSHLNSNKLQGKFIIFS